MKIQGARIRLRRRELGLTQAALAEATEVSQGSIARLEQSREHDARTSTLNALAKALRTSAEYLCGEDDVSDGATGSPSLLSDPTPAYSGTPETLGEYPGYMQAEKQARLKAREVPDWVWTVVRSGNPLTVGLATPSVVMLVELAEYIARHGNASSADAVKRAHLDKS